MTPRTVQDIPGFLERLSLHLRGLSRLIQQLEAASAPLQVHGTASIVAGQSFDALQQSLDDLAHLADLMGQCGGTLSLDAKAVVGLLDQLDLDATRALLDLDQARGVSACPGAVEFFGPPSG